MIATAWKDSSNGFGIRVGKENAALFFPRDVRTIFVEIEGCLRVFRLSETFWTTCPEFRGAMIGDWLKRHKLAPWPRGKPPRVELTNLGGSRYRLSLCVSRHSSLF
jgi:hypothetical protein